MLAPTATENTAAKKSSATRSAIGIRPALPQSFPTATVAVAATHLSCGTIGKPPMDCQRLRNGLSASLRFGLNVRSRTKPNTL